MPALYRAAHLKDPLERALLSRPSFRQASVNVFTCSVLVRVDPATDADQRSTTSARRAATAFTQTLHRGHLELASDEWRRRSPQ
ncbi:MAG: hypothetical protein MJD61_20155 [Proteobacteria bacterium]|nr:hypothetical protein [Pseudomonadota bacterium]